MENCYHAWKKALLIALGGLSIATSGFSEIYTRLPANGDDKVVALTFDACETKTPSFFDQKIMDYVLEHEIPCTVFVSGNFAARNRDSLQQFSQHSFVEIENHSLSHPQHMERLDVVRKKQEVLDNEVLLTQITGRKPIFFRFPAGNYDRETLALVESLGYAVVHWTFASGDPDKKVSAQKLANWVLTKTRPGSILIFHINGRGFQTGAALPNIIGTLKNRGYRFVKLEEALRPAALAPNSSP